MCGIYGLSRAPLSSYIDGRKAIIAGLVAVEPRGPDSTGAAWTRGRQQKVWYHKLVGPASRVARDLDLDRRARIHTAIGHARWASQGAVNETNAHPVVAEGIVLVHNGTVRNDDDLVELAEIGPRPGEVDSWALAALIAASDNLGATHPADLFPLVEGTAAVAWLNTDDPHSLHLARICGSPMTIGSTRAGDFVMSSTRQTLAATARLTGVSIGDVASVPEGVYLRVVHGRIVEWRTFIDEPKPKPAPKRWSKGGITDLYENRPTDWWEESERLLGSALGSRREFEWNEADPWRRK